MKIKCLQVETCCFYIPLRSGAKFFGFLTLTGSLLLLVFTCLELVAYEAHQMKLTRGEYLLMGLDLVLQSIQFCFAMLLLLGIYQDKSTLMPYWLISTPPVAVVQVFFIPGLTWHFVHFQPYNVEWIVCNMITLFNDLYGWLVVYSYYCKIQPPESVGVV